MPISLDDLFTVISSGITDIINFLKDITFEFAGMTFNFWILLITFFVLDALILILLYRRGGKNE
ncbi:MAG: hypothetical protein K2G88_09495 [Oscillospiraceae bacterium]|nr:hypothetical protein [Oscillospiraceae bacterium]